MGTVANPIFLPIATVQHDFETVVTDVREGTVPFEDFWISCYHQNEPSVHGKVRAELDEKDRHLVLLKGRDGVQIERGDQLSITKTRVVVPNRTYVSPKINLNPRVPTQITAFDISPDGSQTATGYDDGTVIFESTSVPTKKYQNMTSRVHAAYISSLRFFPSSRVLLTAGADFKLHILPAEQAEAVVPVSPVRTLMGHTRVVTDTAIVSKGRNVLSSAKDGTIRLWDVSSGRSIKTLSSARWAGINAISLGESGNSVFVQPHPDGEDHPTVSPSQASTFIDPREVETTGKVVFAALQNGSFEVFDLGTKNSVHKYEVGKRVLNAISYSAVHDLLVTGSTDGVVTVFDTRHLSTPLTSFARNRASIEDLGIRGHTTDAEVVVGTEDGLPYVAGVRPDGPQVHTELIGPDCDAVRMVRVTENGAIWTAGDDGTVRKYF
ncbi:WD40 repeat-like protein [Thelephora ganbajun]|uniref:WD40 repeat-like protein n=1 Tax=Thelephora ganbajun TaxID=370292 RepID=A0ACB6ZU33_THEGA|nr:WD40 repeat-like protein [Thelephora ganbajun]